MPQPPQPSPTPPGTKMSGAKLITSALRLIGVVGAGETPAGDMLIDSLEILNMMLDAWNADRLTIFTIGINDFPFVPGQQTYTLGSGGDFDLPRPPQMEYASIVLLSNPNQPLERPLHIYNQEQEWRLVSIKNVASSYPLAVYDDGGFPFRRLSFWPLPNEADNFRLYAWQPLTQFATAAEVVTFPPGYYEAVRYNLAVRLAPEWNAPQKPDVVALAVSALAKIQTRNVPTKTLRVEAASMSDWSTGGGIEQYARFLAGE